MTFAGLEGCFPRENLHQYIAYYDTAWNVIMTEEREKMSSMKRHEKPRGFFNLTAIEHSTNYYEELRGPFLGRHLKVDLLVFRNIILLLPLLLLMHYFSQLLGIDRCL